MKREYPRPQLVRQTWIDLNGVWDFDFDDTVKGIQEKWYESHKYSKTIVVPFPYQSKLSGIHDLGIHDHVWYHREFQLFKNLKLRTILHFAAVDYETTVYVNKKPVGKHVGGSTSFDFDITDFLNEDGNQEITVYVFDPSIDAYISRGKQSWRQGPFECFYDRTTGIWQTVWIEHLDPCGIADLKILPDLDSKSVRFDIYALDASSKSFELTVLYNGKIIAKGQSDFYNKTCIALEIKDEHLFLWSPETPHLYDVLLVFKKENQVIDSVTSYFGMRKISIKDNKILLNNEPYYLRLILDQGYYKEGLLSYPSEQSLLNDIRLAKQMGFNGCRKHEKIEAERWLYYADKEGYLVSLEMPSQYAFKANNQTVKEWTEAIARDFNHPSLFMYVPFNESWGVRHIKEQKVQQDYVTGFYYLTKSLDPSRIVISNDGWEQTVTEVCTIHTYRHGKIDDIPRQQEFYKSITDLPTLLSSIHTDGNKPLFVGDYKYHGEPIILSEFGGISYAPQTQEGWGYTGVDNLEDYIKELKRIFSTVYASKNICGFCYTQLTDVMQEINGLFDYDRKLKIPTDVIKKIVLNK